MNIKLIIGDRNLSSWSMRPWLAMKASGLHFKEIQVLLDRPTTGKQIKRYSPSGKVPVLINGKTTVWDSLAICEYIAELAPKKQLWPKDSTQRAIARSYVAEMHSGFTSLRSQLSMDIHLRMKFKHLQPGTISDIERILELWERALKKSGGPFLFGEFGIVDAFYAPVIFRFISYGLEIKNRHALKYMRSMQNYSAVKEWVKKANIEKAYYLKF